MSFESTEMGSNKQQIILYSIKQGEIKNGNRTKSTG